jgi:hypothetical protein
MAVAIGQCGARRRVDVSLDVVTSEARSRTLWYHMRATLDNSLPHPGVCHTFVPLHAHLGRARCRPLRTRDLFCGAPRTLHPPCGAGLSGSLAFAMLYAIGKRLQLAELWTRAHRAHHPAMQRCDGRDGLGICVWES